MGAKLKNFQQFPSTFLCVLSFVLLFSCQYESQNNTNSETNDDSAANAQASGVVEKTKKVFYSLPSPIESAMILKRIGANYDDEHLNPISNASKYETNRSLSLNMGVYSADLSYASLFEQTPTAIEYIGISKQIADKLGILQNVDDSLISQLEKNVHNPYESAEIISKSFLNSHSFLNEGERPEIAAMMMLGGWIEGLYLSVKLSEHSSKNRQEIIDKILDQRLSIENLIGLLEDYKSNSDIEFLLKDIYLLKQNFDAIKVVKSKIEPVYDKEKKMTILKSKTVVTASPEVFKKICEKVVQIRTSYVQ